MAAPNKDELKREISQILQGADLSALSSKKVRLKLQDIFHIDLADRKKEIDQILMALIAESQAETASKEKSEDVAQTSTERATQKRTSRRSDSSSDELRDSSPPAKRKKKKKKESSSSKPTAKNKEKKQKSSPRKKESKSTKKREAPKSQANVEDSDDEQTINDEELAWRLHQEESRRTRNHSTRKAAQVKSKASSKKQNGASKAGKTGYVADMILSPELASIIGADRMSRHEVVKKMWAIIKDRNLTDPRNGQFHICDDELFKVFGRRRIRTFSMMKYLKGHVKDPSHLTTSV